MQRRRSLLAVAVAVGLGLATRPADAAPATLFRDVPATSWAAPAIGQLSAAGLIRGYPNGTFRPRAPVTGAEAVALAVRLVLGADAPAPPGRPWYAGDMAVAAARGWISPAFSPTAPASRAAAVAILGHAFVGLGDAPLPHWPDAGRIRAWARPGVAAAAAAGLVHGYPDGRFHPRAPLTRAAAAVLFARARRRLFVHDGRRFRIVARMRLLASAYGAGEPGIGRTTATGTRVHVGEMAVDPLVIPLGSYLWVTGYHTPYLPAGGILECAQDTGGAIRGDRVDLYLAGPLSAYGAFGLQPVEALRLAPLP